MQMKYAHREIVGFLAYLSLVGDNDSEIFAVWRKRADVKIEA
jgi:hypothetical protein